MAKKTSQNRAEQLQQDYIEKYGLVGKVEPKSKTERDNRYKLHKKITPYFNIFSRRKLLYKVAEYPENIQIAVDELVNDYGYVIQTTIK